MEVTQGFDRYQQKFLVIHLYSELMFSTPNCKRSSFFALELSTVAKLYLIFFLFFQRFPNSNL